MTAPTVLRADKAERVYKEWGDLTWFASAELGNSEEITVGRCMLKPGQANPKHSHPNCSEVLVVIQGRIRHTSVGGEDVEMGPGDTISIPPRFPHRAENIGDGEAVLMISFTSAHRQVEGE
jgi:quercetin dioxygenase-like cupin family protein